MTSDAALLTPSDAEETVHCGHERTTGYLRPETESRKTPDQYLVTVSLLRNTVLRHESERWRVLRPVGAFVTSEV